MKRLLVLLLLAGGVANGEETWNKVGRIVAVGDVHGGHDAFVAVLRNAKLIDAAGGWIGGRAHLVQTGDVMDRGADSRKTLELLMALEKQAEKAGGHVHALIGNHEAMNMYGDLRYVSPGEFAAFRGPRSQALLEAAFARETEGMKPDAVERAQWMSEHPLGWAEHRVAYGPEGRYGKWIRSHNAIVKVNGVLFLHGGISPKFAEKSLQEINEGVRAELSDFSRLSDDGFVRAEDGPLWYRGIAQEDPALVEHVAKMLKGYGATRIVMGHTSTPGRIVSLYRGTVVTIDAGLGPVYGGHRMCLVLDGEEAYVLNGVQKSPLS